MHLHFKKNEIKREWNLLNEKLNYEIIATTVGSIYENSIESQIEIKF